MSWVPVIDLGGSTAEVAAAMGEACRRVGFLTVTGHGVPQSVVDAAWDAGRAFFDLPLAHKMTVAMPSPGSPYGYSPIRGETLARSLGQETPPDLKESLAIGPRGLVPGPATAAEEWAFSPTLWPDDVLPALRPTWEAYFTAMGDLAARLLRLAAVALGLEATHFDPLIDRHASAMRALNYPALDGAARPGQLRAGAHTDYGTLTILAQQDRPGGLQVLRPDGSWADVPAVPGAFVINLGDAMARWTNDRWVSTMHRVVLPPADAGPAARRQSIAFFHNANWDAVIECLPTCLDPGETPRYPPVAAGPHLMSKFQSTVVPY